MANYEIRGYKSEEDFDNRRFDVLDTGLCRRRDALRAQKAALASGAYAVVKVTDSVDFDRVERPAKLAVKTCVGTDWAFDANVEADEGLTPKEVTRKLRRLVSAAKALGLTVMFNATHPFDEPPEW